MSLTRTLLILAAMSLTAPACDTTYVFDPIDVGEADEGRAPRARSNSQFIRAVYADLIGRQPQSYDFVITSGGSELGRLPIEEQPYLLAALDGVGDPTPLRALIVAGLVRSVEVELPDKGEVAEPAAFIREQFRRYLGRDPGVYELRAFVDEWDADPAVGPHAVVRALLESREYQSF
jgi:hypothetical protein